MHNMNLLISVFEVIIVKHYYLNTMICFLPVALCVSMRKPSGPEVACTFAKSGGAAGQGSAPIISVPTQTSTSQNGLEHESSTTSYTEQPIFFRCVCMPLFVIILIKCLFFLQSF